MVSFALSPKSFHPTTRNSSAELKKTSSCSANQVRLGQVRVAVKPEYGSIRSRDTRFSMSSIPPAAPRRGSPAVHFVVR